MQPVRLLLAAAAVGLVVGALFLLWLGWPGFLSVAAGAVFSVGFLVAAASVGADPREADAAWRERAGDLASDLARPAESGIGPGDGGAADEVAAAVDGASGTER